MEDEIKDQIRAVFPNAKDIRLPTERDDRTKLRGFGFVEFNTADELREALGCDLTIKGETIRTKAWQNRNSRGDGGQGRRQGDDSFSGYNMGNGDNSFNKAKAGESEGVAMRNDHHGVLIDEIDRQRLYDSNHVAGADFDRYKKTEVSAQAPSNF